jgi:predicted metalloprotease with PDZ domain
MKVKYSLSLLAVIILTAGVVLAQQPSPPPPPDEPVVHSFSLFTDGDGFLGVYAENINRENMGRYRVSQVRGVGITEVIKDSPAEKAGLRKDDVILRVDGENVTSVRKFNRVISEIAPDQSVKITVSRGGAEQELTATIGKRSNTSFVRDLLSGEPKVWKGDPKVWKWEGPLTEKFDLRDNDGDLTLFFGNSRRIGVSTVELTKQLGDYFGIADGKGVLVTSVSEDGPAAKAGVKAGDVITAIDGEAVDSSGDISRIVNRKKEGDVTLTVIRNRSQQTFRVTPREGGFSGAPSRSQTGRRIVIPRIEIPSIDINLPRIRVTPPRVRVSRGPI